MNKYINRAKQSGSSSVFNFQIFILSETVFIATIKRLIGVVHTDTLCTKFVSP
jgi:hypothetical protein